MVKRKRKAEVTNLPNDESSDNVSAVACFSYAFRH
jgi:hypothetical protein